MKNFRLFTGNRLESLAERLAEVLKTPLSSPLAKEIIVVQSKGMERWLSMRLAEDHGICANMCFPFPNDFVYGHMFRKVLPDQPEKSPFDPGIMIWKIMKLLPSVMEEPEAGELRDYLGNGKPGLKHYQFASHLANVYDHYLLFRQEWIFAWEQGGRNDGWQTLLWKKMAAGNEKKHRPALARAFASALEKNQSVAQSLPERVSVFGISTLPPFHMELLDVLSNCREVNLFFMNPCAEYWGDLPSRRERRKIVRDAAKKGIREEDLHFGPENPFLSSMGLTGRDFFDLIVQFSTQSDEVFDAPEENSLLSCIQADILFRRERPSEDAERKIVDPSDRSVSVHSCHSPMREVEVLQDYLLALFAQDSQLRPSDILVMTPDIEKYAPFVQAVFDLPPEHPRRIPFSIADRSIRMESRIIDSFLQILELTEGRFSAAQVLSILESPPVRKKFDLSEAELEPIRTWIKDTRIRWGIDSRTRKKMQLPDFAENTWQAGLDRLLLGCAMRGREERLFKNILPYDNIEGNASTVLGNFAEFTNRLFSFSKQLSRARSLSAWAETLRTVPEQFFQGDEDTENEIQKLRDRLSCLGEMETLSGFDGKIDIRIIRSHLRQQFRNELPGLGFITGGVTFCAMLPMRSIPFKIICLMGINSGDYPRRTQSPGFDLMAGDPKPCDRSRRNDDRYLFLESILSARERLYISYAGQSLRDNSIIPPSVLVSELMDCIRQGFYLPGKDIADDHVLTRHTLQAFSPACFREDGKRDNARIFSYSEENCRIARELLRKRNPKPPFIADRLSSPGAEWKNVTLDSLCSFYKNPAKFLLRQRLSVSLEEKNTAIEEKEPFDLNPLDKYRLGEKLVEKCLTGLNPRILFPLRKSMGELPHGAVGKCRYEEICRGTEAFAKKISPFVCSAKPGFAELDLRVNGFRLTGKISNLFPRGMLRYRYAEIKAWDYLAAWIHHLALNSGHSAGIPTVVAGTDAVWEYDMPDNGLEILEILMDTYWKGLRNPIKFFPNSALVYAEILAKEKSVREALSQARKTWCGGYYPGEADNSYFRQCFCHCDSPEKALDNDFQNLAADVFGPLLKHRKKTG
ncbi:MAG: exodeoxyribonuclease V subunit gamma [Desulfobacterales bacterium]